MTHYPTRNIEYIEEGIELIEGSLYEDVDVRHWKLRLVGDGVTDNADAFEAALREGGVLKIPFGRYLISRPIVFTCEACLIGEVGVAGRTQILFTGIGPEQNHISTDYNYGPNDTSEIQNFEFYDLDYPQCRIRVEGYGEDEL